MPAADVDTDVKISLKKAGEMSEGVIFSITYKKGPHCCDLNLVRFKLSSFTSGGDRISIYIYIYTVCINLDWNQKIN